MIRSRHEQGCPSLEDPEGSTVEAASKRSAQATICSPMLRRLRRRQSVQKAPRRASDAKLQWAAG